MTNWYALDQNGDIISLGAHETFEEADACAKYSPCGLLMRAGPENGSNNFRRSSHDQDTQ